MWKNNPDGKTEKHWLDVISDDIEDGENYHWWHAAIKWDGCIHLNHAGNVPYSKEHGFVNQQRDLEACDDYIHICDLNDYIERLIALREFAKKHFGEEWNKQETAPESTP